MPRGFAVRFRPSSAPPSFPPDAEVSALEDAMDRFATGDDGAFARVYELAAPHVYRALLRLSRQPAAGKLREARRFVRGELALRGRYQAGQVEAKGMARQNSRVEFG